MEMAARLYDRTVALLDNVDFPADCLTFKHAWSVGNNWFQDIVLESGALRLEGMVQRLWRALAGAALLPDWFARAAYESYVSTNSSSYVLDEDVARHLALFRPILASPANRLLVVAHSQGNLYANQERRILLLEGVSPEQFTIVAVASPDGVVEGGGPRTTLYEDGIANLFRLQNPTLPLPTTGNNDSPCIRHNQGWSVFQQWWECHDMMNYVNGDESAPRIMGQILAGLSTEDVPPVVTRPPVTAHLGRWTINQDGTIETIDTPPIWRFTDGFGYVFLSPSPDDGAVGGCGQGGSGPPPIESQVASFVARSVFADGGLGTGDCTTPGYYYFKWFNHSVWGPGDEVTVFALYYDGATAVAIAGDPAPPPPLYSQTVDNSGVIQLMVGSQFGATIGSFHTGPHSRSIEGLSVQVTVRETSGLIGCVGDSGGGGSLYVSLHTTDTPTGLSTVAVTPLTSPYGDGEYRAYTEWFVPQAGNTELQPNSSYYVFIHSQCSGGQADVKSDGAGHSFFGYIR
jgi:hypothetical protein